MSLLSFQAQAAAIPTKWDFWPFNSGTNSDWQTSLATYAYSAVILAVICLFLRFLYGPGGIWRDKEMEREAELARQNALDALHAQLAAGEITEEQFNRGKRRIEA